MGSKHITPKRIEIVAIVNGQKITRCVDVYPLSEIVEFGVYSVTINDLEIDPAELTRLRTLAAQAEANARDAELGRRFRKLASEEYLARHSLRQFGEDCFNLVDWM